VTERQPTQYEIEQRQRAALLGWVRVGFLVLFLSVTFLSILVVKPSSDPSEISRAISWQVTIGTAALMAARVVGVDYFTPRKRVSTLFAVFVGLLAAILATIALGFIIDVVVQTNDIKAADPLIATIKVLIGISLSYLGITTVLQTQDDFRLVIPYIEFSKQLRGVRPLVMDSSALIDGRVVDIAQTNFLLAPIIVPQFVLTELQTLADSQDALKRTKGRRGLEVVSRLQRTPKLDVTIDDITLPGRAVDQLLVEYAKSHSAIIVTIDSGLAKVAAIQSVSILNVNDLANALKPALLPGERLVVKLIKQGGQPGQAVGYLPDGMMIVAENGRAYIGQSVEMTVTSALQTSAGRLIFARIEESATAEPATRVAASDRSAARADQSPVPMDNKFVGGSEIEGGGGAGGAGGVSSVEERAEVHMPTTEPVGGESDAHSEETRTDEPRVDDGSGSMSGGGGSQSPYPPKPPRSVRGGTPRNPRR